MKINLNLLPKEINQEIIFGEEYYSKNGIKRLEDVYVKGKIDYNLSDEVEIDLQVNGQMILEDAITLEEVRYPFAIEIKENLADIEEESTFFYEKSKNTLDIIEFLWENIVLEVPISFTTVENAKLKGNGWELK